MKTRSLFIGLFFINCLLLNSNGQTNINEKHNFTKENQIYSNNSNIYGMNPLDGTEPASEIASIPSIPTSHINIAYKSDTTIILSFNNPDTGLPGSLTVTGRAVTNKDKSNSFLVSSVQYSQKYQYFDNLPDDPRNVISLFGSTGDKNAFQMRMTGLYQGNKTYVLELQALDSMSSIWKVKLHDGVIDSVWHNDETRDSCSRNWTTKIYNLSLQMDSGVMRHFFTLDIKQDFTNPYQLHLLDSCLTGRLQLPLANVCLTAPTLEPDWIMDMAATHTLTINLAKIKSATPNLQYTYKDTTLRNALVCKTTIYTNTMVVRMTDNYIGNIIVKNFILGMIPTIIKVDSTWLDPHGLEHDSTFLRYIYLMLYQANSGNVLNKDTAYHFANSMPGFASINLTYNQYYKNFWYDLAATQWARTDYEHINDVTIAPTFKLNRYDFSDYIGDLYDTQYKFRFRIDSVKNKYVLNGGYTYKVIDTTHLDVFGKFVRLLNDDHPNEFIVDTGATGWIEYFNGSWWDYKYLNDDVTIGTNNDFTDIDGIRAMVLNDTTVRLICRALPKLQLDAASYPCSQPLHTIYQIEPENSIIITDPKSVNLAWNSVMAGFKYHLLISNGDIELKNPVVDSLMTDTSFIFIPPKLAPGTFVNYYWGVFAEDHNGDGPRSPVRSFRVLASFPKSVDETGIEKQSFELFPNPADDLLTIKFNEIFTFPVSINILNSLGILVSSGIYDPSKCNNINIQSLPIGTYFCRIISGKTTKTKKLVIIR
ncbi:MAG: T9SS type A sorting domain-containing protein [FCB group bacterium]|jgi:hypothetical protein